MTIPSTPEWASNTISDTATINGSVVTYPNKVNIPIEIKTNGLLAKVPLTLSHLNQQFNEINKNIEYLKGNQVTVTGTVGTVVFSLVDTIDQVGIIDIVANETTAYQHTRWTYGVKGGVITLGTNISNFVVGASILSSFSASTSPLGISCSVGLSSKITVSYDRVALPAYP